MRNFQIQKVTLLSSLKENDPFLVMYSTQSHLMLQVCTCTCIIKTFLGL